MELKTIFKCLILAILKTSNRILTKLKKYPYVIQWLNLYFIKLQDQKYTLLTKIYWLLNDITDFPKCQRLGCNNTLQNKNVSSLYAGYSSYKNAKAKKWFCCSSCALKDDEVKNYRYATCKELYNDPFYNNRPKAEQTYLQLYNSKSSLGNHEIYNKTCKSKERKYGSSNMMAIPEIRQKIINTNIKNLGVEFPFQSISIQHKSLQSIKNKYHVENSFELAIHRGLYVYDNKHFDSKPELAFYIWLIDHKYSFEFHPKIKFEYEFNNKIYFYKPDFLINDKYFEIKGDQFFDKNGKMICPWKYTNWTNEYYYLKCAQYEAKHQCMLKNNVIILKSKEYKQYLDYISNIYGQNYLNKYKKKNS